MTITTVNGIEELKALVGQTVGPSDWREVTQETSTSSPSVSGDDQWIHVDVERAKTESPFGDDDRARQPHAVDDRRLPRRAVPVEGFKMGVNYGWNKIRFPAPVPSGSRIRASLETVSVDEVGDGWYQIVQRWTVEVEGNEKPVCVAESVGRLLA